ncbi:hypothetical protein QFZ89_005911 [Paraburkholderia youngii]
MIGALLCAFCLLQRLIERHAKSVRRPGGTNAVTTTGHGHGHDEPSTTAASSDSQVLGRAPG